MPEGLTLQTNDPRVAEIFAALRLTLAIQRFGAELRSTDLLCQEFTQVYRAIHDAVGGSPPKSNGEFKSLPVQV
jgi:hypothetical protein